MNLVLFLLSFLFASYAPTSQTTDDGKESNTTSNHAPDKGKGNKFGNGDFIIWNDVHP